MPALLAKQPPPTRHREANAERLAQLEEASAYVDFAVANLDPANPKEYQPLACTGHLNTDGSLVLVTAEDGTVAPEMDADTEAHLYARLIGEVAADRGRVTQNRFFESTEDVEVTAEDGTVSIVQVPVVTLYYRLKPEGAERKPRNRKPKEGETVETELPAADVAANAGLDQPPKRSRKG